MVVILIGMIIGRFLNVSIYKMLDKEGGENIFSYTLIALINGVIYGVMYFYFGLSITGIAYAMLGSILLIIAIIDYYTMRIPNELIILGVIIGILHLIALSIYYRGIQSMMSGMIGMLVGASVIGGIMLISFLVFRKEGMGVGDLKLLGMIGLFTGSRYALYTIFIAVIIGGCYGVIVLLAKGQEILPFGPFLSIGAVIAILWGDILCSLYLNYIL